MGEPFYVICPGWPLPEALIRKQGWFIGSGLRIFYSSISLFALHNTSILEFKSLWAPTSGWRPFEPLYFVLRTHRTRRWCDPDRYFQLLLLASFIWSTKTVLYSALCSYPLKLGGKKFGKVKAQFSLNFVPNFKISVLTGKELCKIWGKNIFF